jgi:hypothetical protein
MTAMRNDHDDLTALFARSAGRFSDEFFVTRTMQQIRAARSQALLARRVLHALGIAALAAVSPFLMRGAARVFGELESLFAITNRVLETPVGTVIAILCSIVLVLLSRRRFDQRNW